jgi:hypothetical protein
MPKPMSMLASGIGLFKDDFWRGVGCMAGVVPTHEWPLVQHDHWKVCRDIEDAGGFGFFVCRTPKPGLATFQRAIDGVTRSGAGHAGLLIGEQIGALARIRRPGLMIPKTSSRWKNRPSYAPPIIIEGIATKPRRMEIVESQALVAVNSLTAAVDKGEQIIVFTNTKWTVDQKVAMAIEAYSWVGEPYDVFEIGSWFIPWMFNPKALKVCSTLVEKCVTAGDSDIDLWTRFHKLDVERVAPRDILAYGVDREMKSWCIRCDLPSVIKAEAA